MSKKHLKRLKELQRLQALHQDAASSSASSPEAPARRDDPPVRREKDAPEAETLVSPGPAPEAISVESPVAESVIDQHPTIKKDLIFLVVLIVIMLLGLLVLNWLIGSTSLGNWIINAAGMITS